MIGARYGRLQRNRTSAVAHLLWYSGSTAESYGRRRARLNGLLRKGRCWLD